MGKKSIVRTFLRYIVYFIAIIIVIYPLAFVVFTALKTPEEFTGNFWLPPRIKGITLNNLKEVWISFRFYIFFKNSMIVSAAATILAVVFSLTAGYAFARLKFPFREKLFFIILSVLFLPVFIYVIPLYVQMRSAGLNNTLLSLILVYMVFNFPSGVYIARNYFYTIPIEIKEAGHIDGAGQIQVFTRIILPVAKPIVSCLVILNFINNWGEYIWALVSNTKENVKTIPLALTYFSTKNNVYWWDQMAAIFISVIPIIIFYVIFQKAFIKSFVEGAVKG